MTAQPRQSQRCTPGPLAQELQQIRLALGLTQKDFAARLGVSSQQLYSRYETGATRVPPPVLNYARVLREAHQQRHVPRTEGEIS